MTAEVPPQALPPAATSAAALGDRALRVIDRALAALVLAASWCCWCRRWSTRPGPSISEFGLGFLTGTEWNAVTDQFGALDLIWGTLATSLIALLIAVPIAIAIALFLRSSPRVC